MYRSRLITTLISSLIVLMLALFFSSALLASTPHKISYQGRLTESDGSLVADGPYPVVFNLYADSVGGSALWSSVRVVNVVGALFAVVLGDVVLIPDSVFNGDARYLGISVDGGPEGAPRVPLVAVPYSYHALTADTARLAISAESALYANHATNADTAAYALSAAGGSGAWVDGGTVVRLTTGADSVGIGTSTPRAKLEIAGSLSASGTTNFGTDNLVQGVGALVAGTSDTANGEGASVTGGQANSAIGVGAHVGGGFSNKASGPVALIAGGADNRASDTGATVAGGAFNRALGVYSTVGGGGGEDVGFRNEAQGHHSTVGGGTGNQAGAASSTVAGGRTNIATGTSSSVGGGVANIAEGNFATVAGGSENEARGQNSTVGGGSANYARGVFSTIAGGGGYFTTDSNSAIGERSTIGGGSGNNAHGFLSTISGGAANEATGVAAFIGGGEGNIAADSGAVVSGGVGNKARGFYSVVAGGGGTSQLDTNSASGDWSVVGGGFDNSATGHQAVIAGGIHNRAGAEYVFIGGGNSNQTTTRGAAVGGGEDNVASGYMSAITGGQGGDATGDYSFVGGGHFNEALGNNSVVCGGGGPGGGPLSNRLNRATGSYSFIGGGSNNTADSIGAVIVGGSENYAGGDYSFIGGGVYDSALGMESAVLGGNTNVASGLASSVLGGMFNRASGDLSAAAGIRAIAAHDWSFVWSDNGIGDFSSVRSNEFAIRAGNGFRSLADNTDYGAIITNIGNGDGLRVSGHVSQGTSYGSIYATNTGSSPTMSIWPGSGLAGYFAGDIDVTGSVLKSGGGFKIDNPVDPANGYLYHSSVESPDMMNIYNGNVVLDAGGEATVIMPNYFEALNSDYRYQLTCIGGYAPVYIASEIRGNSFRIAGGSPGLKVSWTVTGVRQDAWAKAHRIPVEVDKNSNERGKYLHPEERGMPASMSVVSKEKQ